jgi:hypothetical protein
MPPSASTSLTRVPLPTPPILGLHDISPTVSSFWVIRSVRAPVLAAPAAASQPAWPPPITHTSYFAKSVEVAYVRRRAGRASRRREENINVAKSLALISGSRSLGPAVSITSLHLSPMRTPASLIPTRFKPCAISLKPISPIVQGRSCAYPGAGGMSITISFTRCVCCLELKATKTCVLDTQ